jgi:hypothetical protein
MAVKGYKTKLFIDDIPLALQISQFSVGATVNPLPYNVLQNPSTLKVAGLSNYMINLSGYMMTDSASDIRAKIQDNLQSSDCVIAWMLNTGINVPIGSAFSNSFASEFSIEIPLDNLITVQGKFERITNSLHGFYIANEELSDSTGALSYYADFGSSGSNGGNVLLIVSDITGSATDATIVIESDDNSSFSSAATEATLQFSAVGTYTASMSGTVDRYVRARVTDLGSATDFTLTILVGVNGITQ